MVPKDFILEASKKMQPKLVEMRRHIHRHPELGFGEVNTSAYLISLLKEAGLEVIEGVGGETGFTALLRGAVPGKTIALRADMDALPLQEQTGLEFSSVAPGVMHACGHDAHAAMVAGTAMVLAPLRSELRGQIKFIFQPCEEKPPGGALGMINAGALKNPDVSAIVGLHVNPYLPTGVVGYKEGAIMAATDMFTLKIKGRGGHGAAPHQTVDAIVVASYVIQALQTIASRQVDPLQPVVVSVGTIKGGQASNIVADEVVLTGTVRTLDEVLRREMPGRVKALTSGIASAFGAACELEYKHEYPVLYNHPVITELVREGAREIFGDKRLIELANSSMGGEDFAFFAREVPGTYLHLGVGKPGEEIFPWHHPKFTLDEEALPVGTALLTNSVIKLLEAF